MDSFLSKYIDIIKPFIKLECAETQLDVPMIDLGINSIDIIEIMAILEETFKVEFPDSLITPQLFVSPRTLYNGLLTIISKRGEHESGKQ